MSEITLVNGSTPSTPSAGRVAVYSDSADKHLKTIDDAGLVVDLTATGGAGGWTLVTETTAARSAAADEFVLVNVATCAVTLPAPVASVTVGIKAVSAAAVTDIRLLTSGAGVLIDGTDYSAGPGGLELTGQYESISVISDGTNWFIY